MLILYYYQRLFLFSRFLSGQRESTTCYLSFWYNVETITSPSTLLLYYIIWILSICKGYSFSIMMFFFQIYHLDILVFLPLLPKKESTHLELLFSFSHYSHNLICFLSYFLFLFDTLYLNLYLIY